MSMPDHLAQGDGERAAVLDAPSAQIPSEAGRLLTAADVAGLLGVPPSWVYAETRAGRMPHVALGPRYRRYRRTRSSAWVAALERGPTPYRRHRPSGTQPEG